MRAALQAVNKSTPFPPPPEDLDLAGASKGAEEGREGGDSISGFYKPKFLVEVSIGISFY